MSKSKDIPIKDMTPEELDLYNRGVPVTENTRRVRNKLQNEDSYKEAQKDLDKLTKKDKEEEDKEKTQEIGRAHV